MSEQWTFNPVFADWNFPYTIEIKEGEEVVATLEGGRVTCMGGDSANNAKVAKCLDRAKTIVREHNSHTALVEALDSVFLRATAKVLENSEFAMFGAQLERLAEIQEQAKAQAKGGA